VAWASKLRFDRRLVDHRPDLLDLSAPKTIEEVLGEGDPPAVDGQAKKQTLRTAVESEPTRDMRRLADHEFDVEAKVRDLLEIALEHRTVTGEAERPAVVARIIGDELFQIIPVPPVEAGDITSIEVDEGGLAHGGRSRDSNGATTSLLLD
jgi:hypothetical protein